MQRRKKARRKPTPFSGTTKKDRFVFFDQSFQVRHDSCFPPFVPVPALCRPFQKKPFHPSSIAFVGKVGRPIDLPSGSRYRKVGFGDEGK